MRTESNNTDIRHKITSESFNQIEYMRPHHTYEDELELYSLIREGDLRSVNAHKWFFNADFIGKLSDDKLRNLRYVFVVATTLSTRFAIEGGLESNLAYNISDSYIQKMDTLNTASEIVSLQEDMVRHFTEEVARTHRNPHATSFDSGKYIYKAKDYIYYHLHEKIRITDIATAVGLSENYLNNLFKRETGLTLKQYIIAHKIEEAKNMLLYSECTESDISEFLAFSSQSHFISAFNKEVGMTPKQYQDQYFRSNPKWKHQTT